MSDVERFEEFFRQFYEKEMLTAARKGAKSFEVDFSALDRFDPELADRMLEQPDVILKDVQAAIAGIGLPEGVIVLSARFRNLPKTQNIRIRSLRADHIGKMIVVDGVVRRASEVKPEIASATYQCGFCGTKMVVTPTERILSPPSVCENPECGLRGKLELISKELYDSRWVTLEEPFEVVTAERPGEITIYLKNDLTSPDMQRKTDPGTRLLVTGVVKEIHKIFKGRMKTQLDIYVEANHIEPKDIEWEEVDISEEDEAKLKEFAADPKIYERLRNSLAPTIYGLDEVKEAIILQLFSGVRHTFPDNTKIRGDIHILLMGDPSTAKSQLLKLASKIIPRGRYASGGGVTGAGLTATVYKDEKFSGEWVLEAGALILANKGIMCIDEFDKIDKADLSRLHEALEQQTVSIAKAAIVATLPAQTSVLAGANPKFSRFDPYKPVAQQIDIPDTLMSRFDLKFALRDVPDKERDEKIASHVLMSRLNPETVEPEIKPEVIRRYIAYARKNSSPVMTREALDKIKAYYLEMRAMSGGTDTVSITLRQNEALLRLAEASAKIQLSPVVRISDADRAIRITNVSLVQMGYDRETGRIDIDRAEGGTPSSHRAKINIILDIIDRLEKQLGKGAVARDEVIAEASNEGLKEADTEEFLQRLKKEGLIFEPKANFIGRV